MKSGSKRTLQFIAHWTVEFAEPLIGRQAIVYRQAINLYKGESRRRSLSEFDMCGSDWFAMYRNRWCCRFVRRLR